MSHKNFEELIEGILDGKLVSATLSSPHIKSEEIIGKISVRPVVIQSKQVYQVSEYYRQKVMHRNLTHADCTQFVREAFERYQQGVFSFFNFQYHVLINHQNKMTVLKKEIKTESQLPIHNRTKKHVLQEGIPVPFLVALDIMKEDGKVFAKKYDKFRQINRFLEMVRDIIEELPKEECIEIVDFGCGKAYLTFALHHYLHHMEKRKVRIIGLDLKKEVIAFCQELSNQLQLEGLTFAVGDINEFNRKENVDLMISLHACDIATDAALEKAIKWNTKVILCVPCCQHELYSQVKKSHLDSLLRHGILKERLAALATDAARADLLTMLGYEVQILEFIDLEHTPKNLLIRAIKGVSLEKKNQAKQRYLQFKNELNIFPSLEKRFANFFN